ncbi:multidrug transporter subunit MdtD, partial [Enterobacter intestinihominis]
LTLMPNYKMQTRGFYFLGFILVAGGMGTVTLAVVGQKGVGICYLSLALLVALCVTAIKLYMLHATCKPKPLFSQNLYHKNI